MKLGVQKHQKFVIKKIQNSYQSVRILHEFLVQLTRLEPAMWVLNNEKRSKFQSHQIHILLFNVAYNIYLRVERIIAPFHFL